MKQLRDRAHAHYGVEAAEGVARHGLDFLGADRKDKVIGGYHPIGSELDARFLLSALDRAGFALALPVVTGSEAPLSFRRWAPGDPTTAGAFGIEEPEASAPLVVPDILLCPLLAFDENGNRLGYGGGFYDRTIRAQPHVRAFGLAYSVQLVDALPVDTHDVPLHAVITEAGVVMPALT